MVSCLGAGVCLIILGVYMMLKTYGIHVEVVNWIPLASYSAATFLTSIGIQAISLVGINCLAGFIDPLMIFFFILSPECYF